MSPTLQQAVPPAPSCLDVASPVTSLVDDGGGVTSSSRGGAGGGGGGVPADTTTAAAAAGDDDLLAVTSSTDGGGGRRRRGVLAVRGFAKMCKFQQEDVTEMDAEGREGEGGDEPEGEEKGEEEEEEEEEGEAASNNGGSPSTPPPPPLQPAVVVPKPVQELTAAMEGGGGTAAALARRRRSLHRRQAVESSFGLTSAGRRRQPLLLPEAVSEAATTRLPDLKVRRDLTGGDAAAGGQEDQCGSETKVRAAAAGMRRLDELRHQQQKLIPVTVRDATGESDSLGKRSTGEKSWQIFLGWGAFGLTHSCLGCPT